MVVVVLRVAVCLVSFLFFFILNLIATGSRCTVVAEENFALHKYGNIEVPDTLPV